MNSEAVLALARNGYRLFPCSPDDKRPLTRNGFHDATKEADTLQAWASKYPDALWGTPDGLVLDIDTHDGGADGYSSYREYADEHGDGGGVAVSTRSGGLHLWYSNPDELGRRIGVRPGLDIIGTDGYAIVWSADKLPALADLPSPPAWVADLCHGRSSDGPATFTDLPDDGELIPLGVRHDYFVRFAGKLRRLGLGAEAIEAALLEVVLPRCIPERPDTRRHMRAVAESVAKRYDPARMRDALALEHLPATYVDDPSEADEDSSWLVEVDLLDFEGPAPEPDIGGLGFCSKRNLWSGESESGKTWGAVALACDELAAGRGVLWIDTDGMGERAVLERLRVFGATDDSIREHFHYRAPSDRLSPAVVSAMVERYSPTCRLLVVDSFNATMGLHALDPNLGADVETFYSMFDAFLRAGFALVVLDHVTKASGGQGVYAIGSERKHSKSDVHLRFDVVGEQRITRDGVGRSALRTNKDRTAYFERPTAGVFVVSISDGVGSWRVEDSKPSDEWKPSALMERVSRFVEMATMSGDEHPSTTKTETSVPGKTTYVREALDRLVLEGYVRRYQDGSATRHETIRPYSEATDPDLVPTPSRPRPDPVPTGSGNHLTDPVPPSLLIGTGDGTEVRPRPETGDGVEADW